MKVQFKVHGLSNSTTNVPTQVEGETINATVPCFEVELVTTSDRHGNQTLRFVGSAIDEARKTFKRDAVINATYEAEAEAKK